jgi:hypothetical protein
MDGRESKSAPDLAVEEAALAQAIRHWGAETDADWALCGRRRAVLSVLQPVMPGDEAMNRSEKTGSCDPWSESNSDEQSAEDREEIDRYLAQLDEEAIAGEIELQRSLEEARRPPWWMFGLRTWIP